VADGMTQERVERGPAAPFRTSGASLRAARPARKNMKTETRKMPAPMTLLSVTGPNGEFTTYALGS
jgi:hypothetical protein